MRKIHFMTILVAIIALLLIAGAKKPAVETANVSGEREDRITVYGEAKARTAIMTETAARQDALKNAPQYVHPYVEGLMKIFITETEITDPAFLEQTEQIIAIYGVFENQGTENMSHQKVSGRVPGAKLADKKITVDKDGTYSAIVQMDIMKKDIGIDLLKSMHTEDYIVLFHEFKAKSPTFQGLYNDFRASYTGQHFHEGDEEE